MPSLTLVCETCKRTEKVDIWSSVAHGPIKKCVECGGWMYPLQEKLKKV